MKVYVLVEIVDIPSYGDTQEGGTFVKSVRGPFSSKGQADDASKHTPTSECGYWEVFELEPVDVTVR